MKIRTYESIAIGDRASLVRTITESDVIDFARITGDRNPLHVDAEYAKQTEFKGRVVHGMFGAGLISNVIGMKLPGNGALWTSQNLEFVSPMRIGDNLQVEVAVVGKHSRDNSIELEVEIRNQLNYIVIRGRGRVVVANEDLVSQENLTDNRTKTVLITGASGDIGSELVKSFHALNLNVIGHYFSSSGSLERSRLAKDNKGPFIEMVRGDLTSERDSERFISEVKSRFEHVDIIVNLASPSVEHRQIEDIQWENILYNLLSQCRVPLELAKAYLPHMKERSFGRIISVSTLFAHGTPRVGQLQYAMGKNALEIITRQIATEYGPFGITANCVAPGMINTGFIADISERARALEAQNTPTRRLTRVDDVSELICFLASEKAGQINGQTLHVSGGALM